MGLPSTFFKGRAVRVSSKRRGFSRLRGGADPEQDYMAATRELSTSLVLVAPLLVVYQVGILLVDNANNGVDFVSGGLLRLISWVLLQVVPADASGQIVVEPSLVYQTYLGVNFVLLAVIGVVIWLLRKRGHFRLNLWPKLLLECSIYALLFSGVVTGLMSTFGLHRLLAIPGGEAALATAGGPEGWSALIASIGAGLHEEIVFRLGLLSGLFYLFKRFVRLSPLAAGVLAVLLSSAIFSAVHHIGPVGDPFTLGVFFYRLFAGVVLAAIFQVRGFAVAVYTHALYDVLVMVIR